MKRHARQYTVKMRDDQSHEIEKFEIEAGTEDEQDAAALTRAREYAEDWAREGEWGDDGAVVTVRYILSDDNSEWPEESIGVEIEPDHDALIRAAGGDASCVHAWTGEGEGGCDENPGVWSLGGTAISISEHCTQCGLHRTSRLTGVQRNPGEHDEVAYSTRDAL